MPICVPKGDLCPQKNSALRSQTKMLIYVYIVNSAFVLVANLDSGVFREHKKPLTTIPSIEGEDAFNGGFVYLNDDLVAISSREY
jgi:hypothetical protein